MVDNSKANKKKYMAFAIDIMLIVIMLLQMLYVFTANIMHEILGIVFGVGVVIHIIQKRKIIIAMLKGKGNAERKFSTIITILLAISIIVLTISGITVSRSIFASFGFTGSTILHTYAATVSLVLVVIHSCMYFYIRSKKKKRVVIIMIVLSLLAGLLGLEGIPYLNRHFKTVKVDYQKAVSGNKITASNKKILTVYFTRVGNTDFDEDVDATSGE